VPERSGAAPRPALLVVNTHSRRGAYAAELTAATLHRAGIPIVRTECGIADNLPDLIGSMADEVGQVVIGGGDGTLNAAAPGLIATGLPLGIVPLGTANDLARTLGTPSEIDSAVQVIAAGPAH